MWITKMSWNKKVNSPFGLTSGALLMLFFSFLFVFNTSSLFAAVNQTTVVRHSDIPYLHFQGHSPKYKYREPLNHVPVKNQKMEFVSESIFETEETEERSDVYYFHSPFIYYTYEPVVIQQDKSLSILPSLFFQKSETVSLVILFHSWKNFLQG
jgi:hypothetical protein